MTYSRLRTNNIANATTKRPSSTAGTNIDSDNIHSIASLIDPIAFIVAPSILTPTKQVRRNDAVVNFRGEVEVVTLSPYAPR